MTQAPARRLANEASLAALAQSSFELIITAQDASGAYPASPTFSAYAGYSWFRDGAFIADGVSRYGGIDSANRFFDWCSGILLDRRDQVHRIVAAAEAGAPVADAEMLGTRFTFAGEDGSDDWWDFQLDGYGTWIWAVVEHAGRHGVDLARWQPAIDLTTDYLVSSWSRPCFDWWEENSDRVHVSTVGCIAAGLTAAMGAGTLTPSRRLAADDVLEQIKTLIAAQGVVDGHLAKWLGSSEVDASLLALLSPLGVISPSSELGIATTLAVESALSVDRGVHRYLADTFYGGGQWPLLSCMLGLAYAGAGNHKAALRQLEWAAETADAQGLLPEQVSDHLLAPSQRHEWIERWGPIAQPLLWSHAMYIRLATELGLSTSEVER